MDSIRWPVPGGVRHCTAHDGHLTGPVLLANFADSVGVALGVAASRKEHVALGHDGGKTAETSATPAGSVKRRRLVDR